MKQLVGTSPQAVLYATAAGVAVVIGLNACAPESSRDLPGPGSATTQQCTGVKSAFECTEPDYQADHNEDQGAANKEYSRQANEDMREQQRLNDDYEQFAEKQYGQ